MSGPDMMHRITGRVVIAIFRQCDGYTTHFYVVWDADSEFDIENFEFEKVDRTDYLIFFLITMGDPKIKI